MEEAPPAHPEEMRASVTLRAGTALSLQATARTMPAGLLATGLLASAVILSVAVLVRAVRRHP